MIDVIVKTLDSQNRSFSVPDDFTVEQFKQHIAEAVSIPVESQRLIYCGRVLDDEKKLFDCNLNGKVIHLVERMPPSHLQSSGNSAEAGTNESGANRNLSRDRPDRLRPSGLRRNRLGSLANGGNAMYLGEMTFPAELIDAHGINIPQLGGRRLLQSRFDLATFMTDQLDNIVHRMEQASSGSEQASAPEQSSAPSASAPSNSANSSNEPDSLEFPHFLVHATVAETFGVETTVEVEIRPESEDQSEGTAQSESTQADTNSGNASANNSAPSSAGANDSENQSGSSTSQRRPPVSPANLGALLQRIEGINDRFRPFMRQYTDVMLNDPVLPATGENSIASVQQVINGVSEAMHFQSHLQHALSELMFDVSETPPRNLRFRPLLIQQSAVFQSSIPVQAVIPTINPPSFQSQSTAPTEDTQEDEEMADAETETEGGESAEVELTATSSAEPAAQSATATDAQPSTETPSAASGTSSANAAQGPGQSQASSNAASGSRRSRIFSNIPGRSVGRRGGGLASLIPGMSSCFDPFLPCNSHHIRDRDRRRNYFFPPGAAIGQITTVTAIPATVEVPTSGENQSSNGQQAQQQTQASNNGGPQSATPNAQGGSEETDPSNLHGGRSLRFRFIEDAMSRLSSTLQGATRANGAGSNAASSGVTGNGANRRGAATLIGMSPIVEMISEPVINLVSNSDGQSRIFRLPPENAANYSSVFSAIASEMANAASQAASQAQSNQPLLSSLLQIVSESMSFEDIITSPNANIPLLNVHSRLQSFIQRRIPSLETYQSSSNSPTDLISNSYSHPLFTRPVREVLSELEPSITRLLRSGEIRDDYRDAITNVMNVIEVKLYNLLGILVYSPDSRSFQQMLYCEMESVARMLFRVLLNRCEHGHDGLHRIAQAFITLIMNSNISQNLKMWIVHATVSFLRSKLIVNPERAANASVSQERSSQQGTSNASNASNGSTTSSSNRGEVSVTPPCSAPSSTSEHLSPDSGSSLANLMQIISQNLSLGDAIRISCGTNVPLSNVGTQLQDFLRRRFPSVRDLQRRSSAPIDIVRNSYGLPEFRSPIRELYSELRAAVLAHLSYAEMRENVDAVTSVMEVIESRLYVFLGVLFFSADWESFETMIRSELNLLARNLLTTIYNCCLHEREGLLQVSQVFLSTIMRSKVPQPLKAWVVYTTISYLRSMLSGSVLRTNEFVRLEQASNQPLSNDITMNANAGPRREAPVLQAAAASPAVNVPSPIPRSASSPEQMDSDSIEEELAPLNPSLPNEPLPEVSIGSEEWHNHVRHEDIQEWVPIITRDAQYQRRQSPQRPFSDAYLSGMPNKRRRLITTAKPQSGRVSQFISESLERAINSAQVGTSTVTSAVVQHASVDPTLRAAYVQQLRTRTDLSSNPDFNPAKYPNANNYFKKK